MLDKSKKISHIELVLENSNSIFVPSENIEALVISNIYDSFSYDSKHKTFSSNVQCDHFYIRLNEEVNKIYNVHEHYRDYGLPYDFLMNDSNIAQVHIFYENENNDYGNLGDLWFFINWEGTDFLNNKQSHRLFFKNALEIMVSDKETLKSA